MSSIITPQLAADTMKKYDLDSDAAEFALQYISYYFHNPVEGPLTDEKIQEYTRTFQFFTGMDQDGALDSQVVRAMQWMPRCGVKDYPQTTIQGAGDPKWGLSEITYYISKYVTGLSQTDQESLIEMAWKNWTDCANFKTKRINSSSGANVIISTGKGKSDNFDGPSGTLAWAYLPPQTNFQGQLLMRFDLDEVWIKNPTDRGILYLNVACHEIGHLIGLEHSQQPKALMAPYYSVGLSTPQQVDDIPRIQSLYGPAAPAPVPPGPTPPVPGGKIKVEIMVNSLSDIKISGKDATDFSLI